jgi:hypothetical protein
MLTQLAACMECTWNSPLPQACPAMARVLINEKGRFLLGWEPPDLDGIDLSRVAQKANINMDKGMLTQWCGDLLVCRVARIS